MKRKIFHFLLGTFLFGGGSIFAAVWQWSATVNSIEAQWGGHPQAFLWIPENCRQVRAIVFANNNMLEEGILQHPRFRKGMARLGIAELLVTPRFDYWQVATNNDAVNAKFDALLKTFADESGYRELEFAPVIPIGHSASATMPWDFAAWNPERTLAILSVHGDAPLTHLTGNPKLFEQVRIPVPKLDDSLTFHLRGTFLNTVTAGYPEKWTGLTNGTPIGHASGGGPVVLSRITGSVEQLSPDSFAIRFNRLSIPSDRRMNDVWLVAKQPGDAKYEAAVQQALMKIPSRLTDGAEQTISFPKIPDQQAGTKSVVLSATSSAGAPVYYYVRQGPVEISGDRLFFSKIPPRAKFPIKVTVVAWQYGRTVEPKLQSAEPVEQSFWVVQPSRGHPSLQ